MGNQEWRIWGEGVWLRVEEERREEENLIFWSIWPKPRNCKILQLPPKFEERQIPLKL